MQVMMIKFLGQKVKMTRPHNAWIQKGLKNRKWFIGQIWQKCSFGHVLQAMLLRGQKIQRHYKNLP